jgi:hypothetical protein
VPAIGRARKQHKIKGVELYFYIFALIKLAIRTTHDRIVEATAPNNPYQSSGGLHLDGFGGDNGSFDFVCQPSDEHCEIVYPLHRPPRRMR